MGLILDGAEGAVRREYRERCWRGSYGSELPRLAEGVRQVKTAVKTSGVTKDKQYAENGIPCAIGKHNFSSRGPQLKSAVPDASLSTAAREATSPLATAFSTEGLCLKLLLGHVSTTRHVQTCRRKALQV